MNTATDQQVSLLRGIPVPLIDQLAHWVEEGHIVFLRKTVLEGAKAGERVPRFRYVLGRH